MKKMSHNEGVLPLVFDRYIATAVTLFMALFVLLICVRTIPRRQRRVFLNKYTGRLQIKDSYWNFVGPHLENVPNKVFTSFQEFPGPDAHPFIIDPPRAELRTADGIVATVDFQVEVCILPYTAEDLERLGGEAVDSRAKTVINCWLTDKLSKMNSGDLQNYAFVQKELNHPHNLASLSADLKKYLLKAIRIVNDYGGITLSREYLNNVAAKVRLEGQASIQEMEASTKMKAAKLQADIKTIEAEAEEQVRLRRMKTIAESVEILKGVGMATSEIVKILTTERLAEAIQCSGKQPKVVLPLSLDQDPRTAIVTTANGGMQILSS